jgi:F-type H+-transporting ATPase subunit b
MLIDWFTVGAQALNFIILVWLLKRYLYKPILDAIDAREKRIAAELADADAKKVEAQAERDAFLHKSESFDRQQAELLQNATEAASAERGRLFDEARRAADALRAQSQEVLKSEARNLRRAIGERTQREVFAIVRKVLNDLATTGLEERMADLFIRRLQELDDPARTDLAKSLKASAGPALIRSAFDLPQPLRAEIQKALREICVVETPLRFEIAPEAAAGIELFTDGRKVGWSISQYLASLEEGVTELLNAKDEPEARSQ